MEILIIDGSHGEGGGQILRSALTLSLIYDQPIRIENIRAGRRKPGLAAQHLTSVLAAAMLSDAKLKGAEIGSQTLEFIPQKPVGAGEYLLDVADARLGGSAGAAMLVLQTVLLPLALAKGESLLIVRGGTHVSMSPSFDYINDVWLPTVNRMGVRAELTLKQSGWYPVGKGEVRLRVMGLAEKRLTRPLRLEDRGSLQQVSGRALAANLPVHIPERMASRAHSVLTEAGIRARIEIVSLEAACAGTGIYLVSRYQNSLAGFSALGVRGKPAEKVAEEACTALFKHHCSGAALEEHLADQMIVPAALCLEESVFSVERVSPHLFTNAWVVERFGLGRVDISAKADGTGLVKIHGMS